MDAQQIFEEKLHFEHTFNKLPKNFTDWYVRKFNQLSEEDQELNRYNIVTLLHDYSIWKEGASCIIDIVADNWSDEGKKYERKAIKELPELDDVGRIYLGIDASGDKVNGYWIGRMVQSSETELLAKMRKLIMDV